MEQQKKISIKLKLITIALALVIIAALAFLTVFSVELKRQDDSGMWQFVIFTYVYAACAIAILVDFFSVCTNIGAGNSFSMENAHSFRLMARTSYIAAFCACARVIWCLMVKAPAKVSESAFILQISPVQRMMFLSIGEALAFVVFAFVCRALSSLIVNAAEIKQENELTI